MDQLSHCYDAILLRLSSVACSLRVAEWSYGVYETCCGKTWSRHPISQPPQPPVPSAVVDLA